VEASVVRDGLVVDYSGAVQIVRKLKEEMEQLLGVTLTKAAGAIPPGTLGKNKKAISNVLGDAMFEVTNIVDEPTAAASVLDISDGAVVDVGGGTTGISIIKNGEVIYTADEATGGIHMSLVLAGSKKVSGDEAERLKKDPEKSADIFPIIQPVVEKMASITNEHIRSFGVETIYLVGGASSFNEFKKVFEKETGITTIKPVYPHLVTPLGVAMNC
jgi:ethanolamine utilization protein EutJ